MNNENLYLKYKFFFSCKVLVFKHVVTHKVGRLIASFLFPQNKYIIQDTKLYINVNNVSIYILTIKHEHLPHPSLQHSLWILLWGRDRVFLRGKRPDTSTSAVLLHYTYVFLLYTTTVQTFFLFRLMFLKMGNVLQYNVTYSCSFAMIIIFIIFYNCVLSIYTNTSHKNMNIELYKNII